MLREDGTERTFEVRKQKRKEEGFWFVAVSYFLRIIMATPTRITTMMIAIAAPTMVHV